ncbi:MAG: M56 family metallopeptidase [Lawsonibacter sp.]|jgi:beta-lactamase regulating signal transducer with metallopeptidase domain
MGWRQDIFSVSLTCGAVILALWLSKPVWSGRVAPRWRCWIWGILALRLLLPLDWSLPQAPVQIQAPAALTAPAYDGMAADEAAALPYGYQGGVANDITYEIWYTDGQGVERHYYDFGLFRLEGIDGVWGISFRWMRIWAVGCTLSLLGLLGGYAVLCRQVRRLRRPAGEEAHRLLEECCEALGVSRKIRLYRMPGLASPMLMGFLQPTILLPPDAPAHTLEMSLSHELTHWKQRDLWYKLLLALAGCIHWFNPLVWWMVRQGQQDVELRCDWTLLQGKEETVRQAYGQAILDQMAQGSRHVARLTTGFSGSKGEVFLRFRMMMHPIAGQKGRAVLGLTLLALVLFGGLVACKTEKAAPQTIAARITALDLQKSTVTYIPLDEPIQDEQWWEGKDLGEEQTVLLAEEAQLLHTWEEAAYVLNPATIRDTVTLSQWGVPGEVEQNGQGEVVRVQLAVSAVLDLAGSDLDFTGYCGTIYAVGAGGTYPLHGVAGLDVDPCNRQGQDNDHTFYTLPLGTRAEGEDDDLRELVTQSSTPSLWAIDLVDGAVTGAQSIWISNGPEVELSAFLRAFQEEDWDTMEKYATQDLAAVSRRGEGWQVFGFIKLEEVEIQSVEDPSIQVADGEVLEVSLLGYPAPESSQHAWDGTAIRTSFYAVLIPTQSGWKVDRFLAG